MYIYIYTHERKNSLDKELFSQIGTSPPQAFRRTFRYEGMVRGGCNYTLNSRFVIVYNIKMHFGKINFSTARERPSNTCGYGQFCSKIAQFSILS